MDAWCKHIRFTTGELLSWPIVLYYPDGQYRCIGPEDQYCPVCGTQRPKEKTLEEKFSEELTKRTILSMTASFQAKILADIAAEHYKGEK